MTTPETVHSPARASLELLLVVTGFTALTAILTWPLVLDWGGLGYRQDNGDGQFSIWNVGWVAHALTTDPARLFDANIFYPNRGTLAYSEANIGAGLLGIPIFLRTQSAFAAHNFALAASFVLSAVATYYLARNLFGSRVGAITAAICFAYTPHVIAHLLHIQLLMTAGIPLSLLAFHRLTDRPTLGRGAALGGAMWLQALFCAYYAVFVMLVIGYAAIATAWLRGWWFERRYWIALLAGAVVAVALAAPLFWPYLLLRGDGGHVRPIEQSLQFSADWHAYFASAAYAHAWMLPFLGSWSEALFPGFVSLILGVGGLLVTARQSPRSRELLLLYGGVGVLAFWASFGPTAKLYSTLYGIVPGFSFMRAPSRFGLLVVFALAILTAAMVSHLEQRFAGRQWRAIAFAMGVPLLACLDLSVSLQFTPVPPVEPVYRLLGKLPRGAVVELPAYSRRVGFLRTRYMLGSTHHWLPLVNAYSDFTPAEFDANLEVIGGFPTRASLDLLAPQGVRYAVFHVGVYETAQRDALVARLAEFQPELRRLYADDRSWLYEIVNAGPLR